MSGTASWNGVSGIWSHADKWTPGVVPGSNTAVTIDAGGSYWVAINTPEAANSVTIDTAVTTDPLLVQNTLTIGTDLTITSGELMLRPRGVIEGGTISVGPNGRILFQGGTFDDVTYQGTLKLTRPDSYLTIENGITLEGAGGTGPGTVDLTGVGAGLAVDGGTLANATIFVGSGLGATLSLYNNATLAASLNLIQTGAKFTLGYGNNDGNINLTETAGITDISGAYGFTNNGIITLGAGNTLDVTGGGPANFTNNGTITIGSNADLMVGNAFTNDASGVIDLNNDRIDAGVYLNGYSGPFSNNGTINVSGNAAIDVDIWGYNSIDGTGTISVAAGSQLEMTGSIASQTVALAGTGSVLKFGGEGFAGSISGLADGDAIVLEGSYLYPAYRAPVAGYQGIAAVSAVISGDELVITPASGSAYDIALSGNVPSSATPIAVGSVSNGSVSQSFILVGGTNYTLAAGGTISGGEYDNLIVATAASLTAADDIDAGSGDFNVMILSGGGSFDLAAPATLTGVADFIATEGQAASGDIASTEQIIDTRAGQTGTITVEPGTDNSANTNPLGIIINGADDSMTFDLSNAEGEDTVNLGSGNETVFGSSVNYLLTPQFTTINAATAAEAGAEIVGSRDALSDEYNSVLAAQTVLNIEAGGVITLNAADQELTVDLSVNATKLHLGALGFIVVNGGAGNDTITAGGENQTLSGGGGTNVLVGSASGGDVFSDTSADLNHDTIKNFIAGDRIIATDMTYTGQVATWTQTTATQGTLSFTDGTHNVAVTLTGSFNNNFVLASGDGVVVTYN